MSKMIDPFLSRPAVMAAAVQSSTHSGCPGNPEGDRKAEQIGRAYVILEELKVNDDKYAAENGVTALLMHFNTVHELDLKWRTVHGSL